MSDGQVEVNVYEDAELVESHIKALGDGTARRHRLTTSEKQERRGSTEPRRKAISDLRIARRGSYLFFAAFFLAAGFFAAFFLAAMFVHLLLSDEDPRFHGLVISFSW
ncbi:MAG TPA: hypothetical protein VGV88_07410 [Candidatus Dormibacteraeota bacterium]|nr:hypothetical protein [Candidatus Dormibacteraeota bacterium]